MLSRSCCIRGKIVILHGFSWKSSGESADHWLIIVHWPEDLTFFLQWGSRVASSLVYPCGLQSPWARAVPHHVWNPSVKYCADLGEIPFGVWLRCGAALTTPVLAEWGQDWCHLVSGHLVPSLAEKGGAEDRLWCFGSLSFISAHCLTHCTKSFWDCCYLSLLFPLIPYSFIPPPLLTNLNLKKKKRRGDWSYWGGVVVFRVKQHWKNPFPSFSILKK